MAGVLHGAQSASRVPSASNVFDIAIREGNQQVNAGRCEKALPAFRRAEQIARVAKNVDEEAIALIWSGLCDLRLARYRTAIAELESGARLATEVGDIARAGAAAGNIGQVDDLLGDYGLAARYDWQAIQLFRNAPRKDGLARAWISYALVQTKQGNVQEGRQSFDQAIQVARDAKLPGLEAIAWDCRGTALLLAGDLADADRSLGYAYAIRERLHDQDGLSQTLEHQAELLLRKQQYQLALKAIDRALSSAGPLFKSGPQYYPIHVRGQILLGLGRKTEALSEFREAVDVATIWRESAMPGDASSTQTVALIHDVYQDYADLAAELSLERHNPTLSRQAFEALAENRAASLREQLTAAFSGNSALPPRYFELLSKLQAAEARVTLKGNRAQDKMNAREIRLELYDLENQIGLRNENIVYRKERNSLQNSLRDIQVRLRPTEVLLSFCLGKKKSFLWAVTNNAVNLYELPPDAQISAEANAFKAAAQSAQNARQTGSALSRTLFGKLALAIWQKPDWLLTLDGALLDGIPLAALPDLSAAGQFQTLITNHTLRLLPSELLLASSNQSTPRNRFVGVGDPIYNLADSRRLPTASLFPTANGDNGTVALARLAGSEREIKTAAKRSGLSDIEILTGRQANIGSLRDALAKPPEILHFAVHVVSPEGQPGEAALALSLSKDNIPELLTRQAVATYRVPGTLVVLSGCSSEQGRTLPGAGLIGLSRAWLLAGAEAVVVSAWPTADDSGAFFSSFYSHLQPMKSGSLAARAATALQQAQLDMARSSGYRRLPSFWAAYSIVSKE